MMEPEPHYGDLLEKTVDQLKQQGFKFQRYDRDSYGKYVAYMTATGEPLPFAMVAKGSGALYGEYVSTQKQLLESWKGPLVLAWKPLEDEPIQFHVFDPDRILLRRKQGEVRENRMRPGMVMLNFSLFLGIRWDPYSTPLSEVWKRVKAHTEAEQKGKIETFLQ